MRIGIQTWGTEGDVRPFIALAGGLSAAGHDVTLAVTEITNQQFSAFGERMNFKIRHVGHIDIDERRFKELSASVFNEWNPLKVEHSSDQPLWGIVLQRIGIAPKLLHRRSVTARKLASTIRIVLDAPAKAKKAKALGSIMQNEDGLARAIELIERIAAKHD
jgi:UDP:flavonoid glycosyltransferase YjiC (YdhE family)